VTTPFVAQMLPQRATVYGVAAVGAYVAALCWAMQHWPYDYWGGFIVAPLLFLMTWPILARIGRAEGDSWVPNVMLLALIVRFAVSIVRFRTIFSVYGGTGDASVYDRNARRLTPLYWAGQYGADVGWPHFIGAGFVIVVTAIVYMLVGPTLIGGFFVFAWFSFIGLVLAYRAFRLALPEGDHRRYLVLLLFLPSMLFWPSSIGKDAVMSLAIGLTLYGTARLLSHRHGGFLAVALGLSAALAVRPHVAALCMAALAVGYLIRPPRRRTSLTPMIRVGGLVVILALTVFVAHRAASFLGVDHVSISGVTNAINDQSTRTDRGNSNFRPAPATNPANIPKAVVTVLFRPFPTEAHNSQAMIAAAEGVIIMLLLLRSYRQILSLPRLLRREPYVATCVVFLFAFIVAFSSFSNFGILARERTQMLPVLLALMCVPKPITARSSPREVAAHRPDLAHPERTSTFS
jgi:hypothetical protein